MKDSTWNYFTIDSLLIRSDQYKAGKLHGYTKTFYESGLVCDIKYWENDFEHGKWIQYFTNGNPKFEANHKHGLRDGSVRGFYPSGEICYKGFYNKDYKSGLWEYFNKDGLRDTIINY